MAMCLGKIKEDLRVLVAACLYYSGLVRLVHWWMRRSCRHLIILNYHRATGGDLRRQLLYLRRYYRIIHKPARSATSVAEHQCFLADMRRALGVPSSVAGEEEGALPLTWGQVREMEESRLVSFGAHTMHHPILGYLADPAEVQQEVQ